LNRGELLLASCEKGKNISVNDKRFLVGCGMVTLLWDRKGIAAMTVID